MSNHNLNNRIAAGLRLKGTSVRKWALQNGLKPSTVYAAIKGERKGKHSQQILTHIKRSANV